MENTKVSDFKTYMRLRYCLISNTLENLKWFYEEGNTFSLTLKEKFQCWKELKEEEFIN